ncbi:MAG: hypothetical protein KZQ66_15780 [Candidatus Thiodiazotropha sp. (ex Lucinoma aequizonata)]|nr:hypothetical protein [Candidatus Thiodiazotropha sp. (ex Lucinoma aequizonata)]MCU7903269.1 hypothetical protein [Candidatus Thiodiazotropha sp. (ex Lucinoma aequizonata)]
MLRKVGSVCHNGSIIERISSSRLGSARQKTYFFREPVLPRLIISGLIINTGAIFSCRHIKNDNNFYLWRLQVIPAPATLAACLVHVSQAALFLRPRFRCSFSCSCCRSTAPRRWMLRATTAKAM